MERELKFEIRKLSGQTIVFDLNGDMNIYNANFLGDEYPKHMRQGVKNFIVNLKNLTMIDSAGIGALFTMLGSVQESGGQTILVSPNPSIRKLFDITQVSTYFTIRNSEAEALQKISGG
jgi:anti-sigma B factor antagonist